MSQCYWISYEYTTNTYLILSKFGRDSEVDEFCRNGFYGGY
jgi:hypothetical protein